MTTVAVNWECVICNETFHHHRAVFCQKKHTICHTCYDSVFLFLGCLECRKSSLPDIEIIPITIPKPIPVHHNHIETNVTNGHGEDCQRQKLLCEGSKFGVWNCDWTGKYSKLVQHFLDKHNDYYGLLITATKDVTFWLDLRRDQRSLNLIQYDRELFYYKYRLDLDTKKFYFVVQMVGPQEKASKYIYRYQTSKAGRICYIQEFCVSDQMSDKQIFSTENCVVLPLIKLGSYTTNNLQTFKVTLLKVNVQSDSSLECRLLAS